MTSRLVLSVVVPAFNSEATIGRCLAALGASAQLAGLERTAWEVVVADNGSSDNTLEVVNEYARNMPIRVVDASLRRGPAAARNAGARSAEGQVIVFTDSDDAVSREWLRSWHTWSQAAGKRSIAAGLLTRRDLGEPIALPATCCPPLHMKLPFTPGSNCGLSRELFDELGGFDESRQTGEDVDLAWRSLALGADIECVPAYVHVMPSRSGKQTLRRYFEYGAGDVTLFRDHRALGPERAPWPLILRSYLGLLARIPLLIDSRQRSRWIHQAGRRAGRLVASIQRGTWFP